jgi:hypothetical protein
VRTTIEIADALVAALNSNSFSTAFTAVRKVRPITNLAELAELKVSVVPRTIEIGTYTRIENQLDHGINILIQKKLSGDIDTDIESVIALVMEIVGFVRNKNLSQANARWLKTTVEPLIYDEHLVQDSVSTSVITVTYRVIE